MSQAPTQPSKTLTVFWWMHKIHSPLKNFDHVLLNMLGSYECQLHLVALIQYFPDWGISGKYYVMATRRSFPPINRWEEMNMAESVYIKQVWENSMPVLFHNMCLIKGSSGSRGSSNIAVFLSAMQEFATLTWVRFIPRTTESEYVQIIDAGGYVKNSSPDPFSFLFISDLTGMWSQYSFLCSWQ